MAAAGRSGGGRTRSRAGVGALAVLVVVAVIAVAVSVALGTRVVGAGEVIASLTGHGEVSDVARAAVLQRVPRTALAMLVGAALALAGTAQLALVKDVQKDPV
ncbi:MAG TPA: iron ABC transporter permease, partial [Actinotalea sp.]|nr:iron ABC transporter permease [Actinotalea sp.]